VKHATPVGQTPTASVHIADWWAAKATQLDGCLHRERPMPVTPHFADRLDAGERLAASLRAYAAARPLIVLGLPRGGVPVAARVAEALDAPLDVFVVRKLGVPGYEEVAMGAIASGGARVFNSDVLLRMRIPVSEVNTVVASETRELERREAAYRGDRHFPPLLDETVIVVDDGAATGASIRVAIRALRELRPRAIIAAVPVASRDALAAIKREADGCVDIITPHPFVGVGAWYEDFSEISDAEVRYHLGAARRRWDGSRLLNTIP